MIPTINIRIPIANINIEPMNPVDVSDFLDGIGKKDATSKPNPCMIFAIDT